MSERLIKSLERIAEGVERLAEDPVIQVETGPPVCPFCNRMNPAVKAQEREASGPLAEFILMVQCMHCQNVFFAIPRMYDCVKTVQEASSVIEEIKYSFERADDGKKS